MVLSSDVISKIGPRQIAGRSFCQRGPRIAENTRFLLSISYIAKNSNRCISVHARNYTGRYTNHTTRNQSKLERARLHKFSEQTCFDGPR